MFSAVKKCTSSLANNLAALSTKTDKSTLIPRPHHIPEENRTDYSDRIVNPPERIDTVDADVFEIVARSEEIGMEVPEDIDIDFDRPPIVDIDMDRVYDAPDDSPLADEGAVEPTKHIFYDDYEEADNEERKYEEEEEKPMTYQTQPAPKPQN